MPRESLSVGRLSSAGVDISPVAVNADGYRIPNGGDLFLLVENNNGASGGGTLIVQAQIDQDGLSLPDKSVAVGASERKLVGPLNPGIYNVRSGGDRGQTYVDFGGAVADLEIQAFRLD